MISLELLQFLVVNLVKKKRRKKIIKMVLIKEVASFILMLVFSNLFVSGGQVYNPHEYEGLNGRRSGLNYEQKNIDAPVWEGPNFSPNHNNYPSYRVPQYPQHPQYPQYQGLPPPVITTAPGSATTIEVKTRNNFGDLPEKCGPNQEKIHGECQDV